MTDTSIVDAAATALAANASAEADAINAEAHAENAEAAAEGAAIAAAALEAQVIHNAENAISEHRGEIERAHFRIAEFEQWRQDADRQFSEVRAGLTTVMEGITSLQAAILLLTPPVSSEIPVPEVIVTAEVVNPESAVEDHPAAETPAVPAKIRRIRPI